MKAFLFTLSFFIFSSTSMYANTFIKSSHTEICTWAANGIECADTKIIEETSIFEFNESEDGLILHRNNKKQHFSIESVEYIEVAQLLMMKLLGNNNIEHLFLYHEDKGIVKLSVIEEPAKELVMFHVDKIWEEK